MSRKDNLFKTVPVQSVPRNLFDLSHEVKMSGKFGYLYPVLLMDTLPGDNIHEQMTALVRFAPMLAPVMHRCDVTTHFFFVPNRLICGISEKRWEDFITGGQDGQDGTVLPYFTPAGLDSAGSATLALKGTLWDYLGLPVPEVADLGDFSSTERISALPFIAYQKVWSDYYRDPTFDVEIDMSLVTEGDNSATMQSAGWLELRQRGYMKDYFTSALPWPQRGDEVLMPLAGLARTVVKTADGEPAPNDKFLGTFGLGEGLLAFGDDFNPGVATQQAALVFDSSGTSINDLRLSLAMQHWLEINARAGGRYIEQIKAHYDETVPDFRLQRAEYLGGGKQAVQISQVLATAQSEDVPVGDMAGHGISVGKSNRFQYKCKEHGWVIGIMSITFTTAYQQGIDRMWFRQDKYDFAFPSFAHLGEQEIRSKEIYMSWAAGDDDDNNELFGYIPRYAEYKFKNDRVAGDFRDTLAFWHLGRIFVQRPTLDSDFTTLLEHLPSEFETTRRIFAVQDGTDYIWCQLFHRLTAKRPLPYFGVPKLIG